jgi:putative phosphoesterase
LKKILLISDTHGYLDPALEKHISESDEVWHAGDVGVATLTDSIAAKKPVRAVWGNIDGNDVRMQFPETANFICEGLKVCITHIGGYPGKYPAKIKALLKEQRPGLFICGHSHILKVIYDKELSLLHINPGACGVHGFHHVKTAVRFTIDRGEIKELAVIELGKRVR